MEKFKLENFKKEYGFKMPLVKTMSFDECRIIRESILLKFNIDKLDNFFIIEEENFIKIENVNAEDKNLDWFKLLNHINIPIPHEIYINFNRFDKVDVIHFKDFDKYFSDIWYPSSDDIEIFDITNNWFVSVRHYGAIYYMKIKNNNR